MGIKSFYASHISPLLRRTELGERLAMALVAFQAKMQLAVFVYADSGSKIFPDSETDAIFSDLDERSREIARRFMGRQLKSPPNGLMLHPKYFYTEEERAEAARISADFNKTRRRFHFPRYLVGPESLYYHHGLRFAPEFVKQNIAGKLFADVGGWLGDSALIFEGYSPEKTIIFEPFPECCRKLQKKIRKHGMKDDRYELLPFALSDKRSDCESFPTRTLDEIRPAYSVPFGLLKADVEGMGLKFLQGARETIMKDRPLLSLAIYHNEEEFAGIYQTLKSWDLNYHAEILALNPLTPHSEVTLFAYPAEWKETLRR